MSQSQFDVSRAEAGIEELSTSDRNRLLVAERRRVILEVLQHRTGPVELEDLAATIAAREGEEEAVEEDRVTQVAISLHHMHLPMMADLGVVEYDPEANRVESGPGSPDR